MVLAQWNNDAYLRAREMYNDAFRRWRDGGGRWTVGLVPTHPNLFAEVTAARENMLAEAAAAMPPDQSTLLAGVDQNDPDAVETAVRWLATDPFVWRSGYYKQRLMVRLRRATLTPAQVSGVQDTLLELCRRGPRQEFRESVKLGLRVNDTQFRERLRLLAAAEAEPTTTAATRMLTACEAATSLGT